MVIGSANWGKEYNGYQVPQDEVLKMLEYFEANGGEYINTAYRYECFEIINTYFYENESKLKLIWNDTDEYMNIEGEFCNAIYYPHEVRQEMNIISIPNSDIFLPYLEIMKLHSKVLVRSVYNLPESNIWQQADGVIVGCDSLPQLQENMERFK